MFSRPTSPRIGDIFRTSAQVAAIGLNAAGRLDHSPLHTALHDRYPVFVSDYRRRGNAGHLAPGDLWVWRESSPWIIGLVVQETPHGIARGRYVEAALLNLVKRWEQEGLHSLAIMRLGDHQDWPHLRAIVADHLAMVPVPVWIYDDFQPGINAENASPTS